VADIQAGETIGEIQFLTGGNRTAGVVATKDTKVIKLSKTDLDSLGEQNIEIYERLNKVIRRRLQFNQLAEILPRLFGSLQKDEMRVVTESAKWQGIRRGEVLFRQGDESNDFYILVSGRMIVEIENVDGNHSVIRELGRGECIGELAILSNEKRSATVRAVRDCELFKFNKFDFVYLLKRFPSLLLQISRVLVERLRGLSDTSRKDQKCAVVVILPVNDKVPLKAFSQRLMKVISSTSVALHLGGEKLDEILETPEISQITEDNPNHIRVQAWLSQQEQNYRFVILETDNTATNWTKFCLRQADHIMIVGEVGANPALCEIEEYMMSEEFDKTSDSCALVLIHPDGLKPAVDTNKWLEKRNVSIGHHVRWDTDIDFQRIVRFLSGTCVGLVLSGGGARAFAHIGVIKALAEAEIPIDMIGGTSAGAIISAQYALGMDCAKKARESAGDVAKAVADLTLPLTSLLSGGRVANGLRDDFGQTLIEDLWLPFFCVSSNMSRAEKKVHTAGSLLRSVRASCAAPGIFPPVVIDGDLHVDGAILSNLPADVMKNFCQGIVISVDVCPAVDLAENIDYGENLSGWKILWSKINPFIEPIKAPDIRTILQRAGELASILNEKNTVQKSSDLYLRIPVEQYQLKDFDKAQEIIKTGYQYAKEKITEWEKTRF
ncbi:MAG: cyclic nucleotide-binding and patatin-like phospholipase domain-containing protein, partial [Gallionellaceae bacterium]